jgi:hypothetical protein
MKKYIIGFAVLLAIAVFLIGCGTKTTIYPAQSQVTGPSTSAPAAPAATPRAAPSGASSEPEKSPSTPSVSGAINELKNCESAYGIGWVPNSCEYRADSFKVTLKAVGQNGISGIAFYVVGTNGVQKVLTDDTKVSYLQTQPYSFSISDLESKVGSKVQKILAMPIKSINGMDNACINQQLLIIKDEACRG